MDPRAAPTQEELLAHAGWVRQLARTLVESADDADDLEQEAWSAALSLPPRHGEGLRGWWRRVVGNAARKRARSAATRLRHEVASADSSPQAPSAADIVARAELHRRVVDAVLALDEPYRTALLLRFFDELPPRAMAMQLAIPVETVRTRVKRGVAQLAARLAGAIGDGRRDWRHALASLAGGATMTVTTKAVLATAAAAIVIGVATWQLQLEPQGPALSGETVAHASPEGVASADLRFPSPIRVQEVPPAPAAPDPAAGPSSSPSSLRSLSPLAGRVVDRRGAAVANAAVFAFPPTSSGTTDDAGWIDALRKLGSAPLDALGNVARTSTGADGRFAFATVGDHGSITIAALHDLAGCSWRVSSDETGSGRRPDVDLVVAPPIRIAIRVVDGGRAPLPHATVRLDSVVRYTGARSGSSSCERAVDAGGRLRVEMLPVTELQLIGRCLGYDDSETHVVTSAPDDAEQQVELRLAGDGPVTLRGSLELAGGGSAGAWLRDFLDRDELAREGPSGLVMAVVPLQPGPYAIESPAGLQTGQLDVSGDGFELVIDPRRSRLQVVGLIARNTLLGWIELGESGREWPADAALVVDPSRLPASRQVGRVSLRAMTAEDGTPIDSSELTAWIWRPQLSFGLGHSTSSTRGRPWIEEGALVFAEVPLGRFQLGVRHRGREPRLIDVELTPSRPTADLSVALPLADGTLSITFDRHAGNASVILYEATTSGWTAAPHGATVACEDDRALRLHDLPHRRFLALVQLEDVGSSRHEVDLTDGSADVVAEFAPTVHVTLVPEFDPPHDLHGPSLTVRVVDEAGQPLLDWLHPASCRSTRSGSLTLRLPLGRCTATLFALGYDPGEAVLVVDGPTTVTIPLHRSER